MTANPERAEAGRIAAAMISCILNQDAEGASALVNGSSRYVLGQALADLARWVTSAIPEDNRASALAELTEALRNFAAGDEGYLGDVGEW
jgi:hypothetical protein